MAGDSLNLKLPDDPLPRLITGKSNGSQLGIDYNHPDGKVHFFSRTYSIDEWGTGIIRILFENGLPKESNRVISAFFLHLNGNFLKHSHVSDSWVVDLIIIPVFVPTRFTLSRMLFHV